MLGIIRLTRRDHRHAMRLQTWWEEDLLDATAIVHDLTVVTRNVRGLEHLDASIIDP